MHFTTPNRMTFGIALALVLIPGVSQAALTVYTTQAAFDAAVAAPGVDTYTGFSIVGSTPSPINRTAGGYAYTGTASTSSFFGAGTTANPWLSTNTATDVITFNVFPPTVSAAGALFFGSNVNGQFAAGSITIVASDSAGATSTQTVVGSTTTFLGFVSDTILTSLTVTAVQPAAGFLWPTVDNLTLALVNSDILFANGFD